MPEPSSIDPAGLPALLNSLDELLCDPAALLRHPIYGKPWADAKKEADRYVAEQRKADPKVRQSRNSWDREEITCSLIRIECSAANDSIRGYLNARDTVRTRRHEVLMMISECESIKAKLKRKQTEIATLVRATENPDDVPEFAAAKRAMTEAFDTVREHVKSCDLIDDPSPVYRRGYYAVEIVDTAAQEYLHESEEGLAVEIHRRLEEARIEYHKLSTTLAAQDIHSQPSEHELPPDPLASIPPLDMKSDDWVLARDAAEYLKLETSTLASYRAKGTKAKDGLSGIDKSGRVWRKHALNSTKVWYFQPSFLEK